MLKWLNNKIRGRYQGHNEAVIISCYFNPDRNSARLKAFKEWYETIKHLNHRIIEAITPGRESELPRSPYITRVVSASNLWHKEQLLNRVVAELPLSFKYVLWVDADVLFTNKNWVVDAVREMRHGSRLVQLFEYAYHLDRNQVAPDPAFAYQRDGVLSYPNRRWWKSYGSNFDARTLSPRDSRWRYRSQEFDERGHCGFAWGAPLWLLKQVPLFERAFIGSGDAVIAYSGTGQLEDLQVVRDMFPTQLQEVYNWGRRFYACVNGKVGYVNGDLHHIWHGDIAKRQYYSRHRAFAPAAPGITQRDAAGLFIATDPKTKAFVDRYRQQREKVDDEGIDVEEIGEAVGELGESISEYLGSRRGRSQANAPVADPLLDPMNPLSPLYPHLHQHSDYSGKLPMMDPGPYQYNPKYDENTPVEREGGYNVEADERGDTSGHEETHVGDACEVSSCGY